MSSTLTTDKLVFIVLSSPPLLQDIRGERGRSSPHKSCLCCFLLCSLETVVSERVQTDANNWICDQGFKILITGNKISTEKSEGTHIR